MAGSDNGGTLSVERRVSFIRTFDCTCRAVLAVAALAQRRRRAGADAPKAQPPPAAVAPAARPESLGGDIYVVFLAGRTLGREELAMSRQADGWILRGTSRLNPPVGTTVKHLEVRYDPQWRPQSLQLDAQVQGVEVSLKTTFADGKAVNALTEGSDSTEKVDAVSADTVVLPNVFFGSYAALAARLAGAAVGAELKAYIAPQAEIPVVVTEVTSESIETPKRDLRRQALHPGDEEPAAATCR